MGMNFFQYMMRRLAGNPKRRAVFFDRDGVILEYKRLLTEAADMTLAVGAPDALKRLQEAGYALVVVTNQSVVARGMITEEELQKLHQTLTRQFRKVGVTLDGIYYCPHHPDAQVEKYRIACECRKPGTLLIRRAAKDLSLDLSQSFFIGDEDTDTQAGTAAGLRTIFIGTSPSVSPTYTTPTITDAVNWILNN